MDDLTCSLSQIIHLCHETSIFLHQLSKFESQLEKFYSSSQISLRKHLEITERFSMILKDLNLYYENYFVRLSTNIFNYLSRKSFTVNYSNEMINDFNEDFKSLNHFFQKQKKSYPNIFDYLHRLSITCLLCIQYRRLCTDFQLARRFVYIRMELLMNLRRLNEEMRFLLIKINSDFERRSQLPVRNIGIDMYIRNLFRTIILWLILFMISSYFLWPIVYETKPKSGWFL